MRDRSVPVTLKRTPDSPRALGERTPCAAVRRSGTTAAAGERPRPARAVRLGGAALALALCMLAAALAPPQARAGTTSATCSPVGRSGRFFVTLPVAGVQRSALVNVPPGADGTRRLPLMLVFHGAGGTGPAEENWLGLTRLGNREGFIAVYPTSHTKYWNVFGSGWHGEDDIQFIRSLLGNLDQQLCVDDQRVYAAGVSNGAGFVARLGCELSDRLTAIASVAGIYGVQPPCHPTRPLSVLEIHGTADRTVPYNGTGPTAKGNVAAFVSQWTTLDQCPTQPPVTRRFAPNAVLYDHYGCAAGTTVAHIKLIGGVHAWPGDAGGGAPLADRVVSATAAVWKFFECQSAAGASGPGCPTPQLSRVRARRRAHRGALKRGPTRAAGRGGAVSPRGGGRR